MTETITESTPVPEVTPAAIEVTEIPTFDALIKRELKKYDDVIPKIEEISAELLPLTITGIDDKEGYTKVSKGLSFVVSKRTAVEAKRKELKADSITFGNAVDARAKEIVAMLAPIESHLRTQKEKIDAIQKEIDRKKEEDKQVAIKERHKRLIEIGMNLIGNEYQWNSTDASTSETLLAINLETLGNNDFENFVLQVTNLKAVDDEKQAQIKADKKKEEERIAAEKEELEQEKAKLQLVIDNQNKKIAEEKAAFEKEKNDMLKQRAATREESLTQLGANHMELSGIFTFGDKIVAQYEDVFHMDAEAWTSALVEIKANIESIKLKQKEQAELDEKNRLAETKRIQEKAEKVAADKLAAQILEDKRLKDEAEKLEKERVANLSDKQKFSEYAKKLLIVEQPEMKTPKWTNELKNLLTAIEFFAK